MTNAQIVSISPVSLIVIYLGISPPENRVVNTKNQAYCVRNLKSRGSFDSG